VPAPTAAFATSTRPLPVLFMVVGRRFGEAMIASIKGPVSPLRGVLLWVFAVTVTLFTPGDCPGQFWFATPASHRFKSVKASHAVNDRVSQRTTAREA